MANRQLKFRVWDTVGKNWMKIFEIDLLDEQYLNNPEYVLQQFTGFHVKNDREIYEGDIVKFYHSENKQYYIRGTLYFGEYSLLLDNLYYYTKEPPAIILSSFFQYKDLEKEIIGNIYENPELLKQ